MKTYRDRSPAAAATRDHPSSSSTVLAALAALTFGSSSLAASPPDPIAAWDAIRTLAGPEGAASWDADLDGDGAPDTVVSYRVIGGGTALVETLFAGTGHEMETIHHLDRRAEGTRLLCTHYCGAGNQPRLLMTGGDLAPDGDVASRRPRRAIVDSETAATQPIETGVARPSSGGVERGLGEPRRKGRRGGPHDVLELIAVHRPAPSRTRRLISQTSRGPSTPAKGEFCRSRRPCSSSRRSVATISATGRSRIVSHGA